MIRLKRIYETPTEEDGYRVLVDRLWPRGMSKENAHLDEWLKGVAPSTELRKWYNHESDKFPEFKKRYITELLQNPAMGLLRNLITTRPVITLLYAAKNPLNEAFVLKTFLEDR